MIYLKYIFIFFELFSLSFLIINRLSFISFTPKNYINNSKIFKFIKKNLVNDIYKRIWNKLIRVNSLYITGKARFGNFLISINNAIIFCELLGCKQIIIQNNNKLFINHSIFYPEYNITIKPNQKQFEANSLILNNFFFYNLNIKSLGSVNRLNILKKEILNNLPKIKTHADELAMYIRSGDIFSVLKNSIRSYAQPPLCFYENILNNFKFKKVNIISENNLNPVIIILLQKYSYIEFNKHDIKYDIAYLANSFNVVSAKSSFLISIIKLNDKLKFLWEYDFYKLSEKYFHLHPSVYSFPYNYTIYKMVASLKYKKFMYPYTNSKKQRELMKKEKCNNNFVIIKPRI